MKIAVVALAACATPAPPTIGHHAPLPTRETFIVDAPLFTLDEHSSVIWTLERDGENAHLALGDRDYVGTAHADADGMHLEVGEVTMDCKRTTVRVHAAGSRPLSRGDHPACSTPRAWQPAELVTTPVLACTVRRPNADSLARSLLATEVTMAPPPGLQAVVDDCCDDEDRCERRWEIRRRE